MRLIDTDALIKSMKSHTVKDNGLTNDYKAGLTDSMRVAVALVENAPTIDAVEVVRCRDCIYAKPVPAHAAKDFTDKALSCEAQRGDWKRAYGFSVVAAWGYCNEGERKEPDHE